MSKYRIKNWTSFQHYQTGKRATGTPEWIKLYHRLIDDMEFNKLSGEDAKALILLWLIASEHGGELPAADLLAFRLRVTDEYLASALPRLSHWLEESHASKLLADGYRAASPEEKREEEKEKRIEREEREREGEEGLQPNGCLSGSELNSSDDLATEGDTPSPPGSQDKGYPSEAERKQHVAETWGRIGLKRRKRLP